MNKRKILLAPLGAFYLVLFLPQPALAGPGTMSAPVAISAPARASLLAQLETRRAGKGHDARLGFQLTSQHPGAQGTQVARVAHTWKGVRVFGAESVLVLDGAGRIVSESVSERSAALAGAAHGAALAGKDIDVKPAISPEAAVAAALASLRPTLAPELRHAVPPSTELIIWPMVRQERTPDARDKPEQELNAVDVKDVVDRYELAYLVRTRIHAGDRPVYHDTIVSARNGAILDQWSMLQTVVGVGRSQYNGEVPVNTTLVEGKYKMVDDSRGSGGSFGAMAITNADHGTSAGKVYVNDSNTWGDGKQYVKGGSTVDANGQTAAVNAMWGLMNTYDTLKNVFNWRSLDGHDTATHIAVHVRSGYDNAYYSDACRCMFIGDGNSFNSLGSIDVIGHEMGHGITAATSNLTYSGESGGLNESASDINGEVVEAYARAGGKGDAIPAAGNDWLLGAEISKTGTPLRWMMRPSRDGSSPDAWSTSLRRIDVHYSSGPNNRMFYFLSQGSGIDKSGDTYSRYLVKTPLAMSGIGLDKAYRIWFLANITKFTASTNYVQARSKMIETAEELYGKGGRESLAVQRAYAAINVGADVDELAAESGR